MRVIDGMHRLRAALLRGEEEIEIQFFDGTDELAFLLAVRANISHGLPLSRADRMAAARRIIESQPQWSNRAIATVTGLSPGTVNAARQRITGQNHQLNTRLGQDGRARPLNGANGRLRASKILESRPDLPLRELAKAAGVSVGTARDVRERIRRGMHPLPPRQLAAAAREVAAAKRAIGGSATTTVGDPYLTVQDTTEDTERTADPDGATHARRRSARPPAPERIPPAVGRMPRGNEVLHWPSIRQKMTRDPALKYAESGRALVKWLDAHVVDAEDWKSVVDAVPPHWSNDIADLARSCAERWLDIAHALGWRPPDR
jgi:hypothetical protein